jgi:cyclase
VLLKRVIPCLDVDKGRVVKGVQYVDHVDAGDPVEVAQLYDAQEADEITFLDITASHEGRRTIFDVVARTAETVFMPLTVGGGVRGLQDVRDLLNAGADKVSIMTAAVQDPELVARAASKIGSANLVVAIDSRQREGDALVGDDHSVDEDAHAAARALTRGGDSPWEVATHGGRRPAPPGSPTPPCRCRCAGEILLTSMDRDGTRGGYDLAQLRAVADAVPIPVIASGGGGSAEDLAAALSDDAAGGHCQAALAASIFHFRHTTIPEVKRRLMELGVPVRPPSDSSLS